MSDRGHILFLGHSAMLSCFEDWIQIQRSSLKHYRMTWTSEQLPQCSSPLLLSSKYLLPHHIYETMRQWQGKGFKQLGMTGTPKLLSTRPNDTALLAAFQVHSVSKPIKTRRTTSHTHSQVSPVNTQLLSGSSRAPHVSNFMRFQKEERHILDFNWNS